MQKIKPGDYIVHAIVDMMTGKLQILGKQKHRVLEVRLEEPCSGVDAYICENQVVFDANCAIRAEHI